MRTGKIYLYSQKNGWFDEEGIFLFEKPVFKIRYRNNILTISDKRIKTDKPLLFIQKVIKKHNLYGVGFISYDFKEKILKLKKYKKSDIDLPDIYINLYRNYKKIHKLDKKYKTEIHSLEFEEEKEQFIEKIKKAKRYISDGDIYQINLSHRLKLKGIFDLNSIFNNLIQFQPTPFLMMIKEKDFSLISASMELFLKKENFYIISEPIKGTIKRGKTKKEDKKLEEQLKNSEKEKAENLMITDLMRNDIGKISKIGTVKVKDLFKVEKYKTLFQMSSTVEGELKEEIDFNRIIKSTFPPGSVTGAPKFRAVEIIDELEKEKRTVYCGVNVLIKPNMDFVSSVAIRQSIFQKDKCFIYVGSGIVADSIPEKEYEETILKAKANIETLK
jgi:anthranilate/para-aminobenzoate synthase component I